MKPQWGSLSQTTLAAVHCLPCFSPVKFQAPSRETNICRDTMLIVELRGAVYIFGAGKSKHVKAVLLA